MLTILEKVMFLRHLPLFSNTRMENLARVASIAQEVEFRKGEVIFQTNDPCDALYFIMRGAVRLHQDDVDIFIVSKKVIGFNFTNKDFKCSTDEWKKQK